MSEEKLTSDQSFKIQMENNSIPALKGFIEKEIKHLKFLKDQNAPKEMIEKSEFFLNHYKQRHDEYVEYIKNM